MIRLERHLRRDIRAEGEAAYPDECCGILLGTVDARDTRTVAKLRPVVNAREAGERYHRFRMEADDILRAERLARSEGLDILGFYHSHPDQPAVPSGYDREYALPWYSYVIVAVLRGKARSMTFWTLAEDRSRFLRERSSADVSGLRPEPRRGA
ncbi:MAG: M67 family metallopeptidase [Desulfovibrio sp.]|jgi:proteasome lid subunit RPN8/RPN11|nr:M67 family metallopeptidase [Desulfovibrio sp.]